MERLKKILKLLEEDKDEVLKSKAGNDNSEKGNIVEEECKNEDERQRQNVKKPRGWRQNVKKLRGWRQNVKKKLRGWRQNIKQRRNIRRCT